MHQTDVCYLESEILPTLTMAMTLKRKYGTTFAHTAVPSRDVIIWYIPEQLSSNDRTEHFRKKNPHPPVEAC